MKFNWKKIGITYLLAIITIFLLPFILGFFSGFVAIDMDTEKIASIMMLGLEFLFYSFFAVALAKILSDFYKKKSHTLHTSKDLESKTSHTDNKLYLYIIFLIFGIHLLIIYTLNHFYYVIAVNVYQNYELVILFETGLLTSFATKKYFHASISIAVLYCLIKVVQAPMYLMVFFVSLFLLTHVAAPIALGVLTALVLQRIVPFGNKKFLTYGLIVTILLNLLVAGMVMVRLDNCESNAYPYSYSSDDCYASKAQRYNDENICANITTDDDRDLCYEKVIFDFDKENYHSLSQCDSITQEKDRQKCYVAFAEMTFDESICIEHVTDENMQNECMIKVNYAFCDSITFGNIKDYCESMVRKMGRGDAYLSDTSLLLLENAKTNGTAEQYEAYKKLLRSEIESGDDQHRQTTRLLDIDEIKYLAREVREDVLSCENDNLEIGDDDWRICGDASPSWPDVYACGNKRRVDAVWSLNYEHGQWEFTLKKCTKYPECSGRENLRCTRNGCTFSEKCTFSN